MRAHVPFDERADLDPRSEGHFLGQAPDAGACFGDRSTQCLEAVAERRDDADAGDRDTARAHRPQAELGLAGSQRDAWTASSLMQSSESMQKLMSSIVRDPATAS